MVIYFDVLMPLVHVHEPLGMITVSPFAAELTAVCTSETLQEAALTVFACASLPDNIPKRRANKTDFIIFVIAEIPFKRAETVGAL